MTVFISQNIAQFNDCMIFIAFEKDNNLSSNLFCLLVWKENRWKCSWTLTAAPTLGVYVMHEGCTVNLALHIGEQ